jgi:prepilin peptidase CpaA
MFVNPGHWPSELSVLGFLWLGCLVGTLVAAVWWDLQTRRIPNGFVVSGMVFGLCWHALAPGGLGSLPALAGLILGLALFLPLYLMRAMGAGDVKLMAMVGVFLGPFDVLGAVLGTFLAGGVIAILTMARLWIRKNRFLSPDGVSRRFAIKPSLVGKIHEPALRLPYALAIALGTLGYLGWRYFSLVVN